MFAKKSLKLRRFINSMMNIGLDSSIQTPPDLRRNVRLINLIYIIEVSVIILYHPFLIAFDQYATFWYNNVFVLNGSIGLLLNFKKRYASSFYNFLLLFPVFILCFCFLFGDSLKAEYYYFFVIPILWLVIDNFHWNVFLTCYNILLFVICNLFYATQPPYINVPHWYILFGYANLLITLVALAIIIALFKKSNIEYLQKIEKNNGLLKRLISIISHDIRSPLNSVQSTLMLIKKKAITPDEQSELISKLDQNTKNTLGMLNNLLLWVENQSEGTIIKKEKVNLYDLVVDTFEVYRNIANDKKITIKNQINKNDYVIADMEMIRIVIRNLMNNAVKFTLEHGKIVVYSIEESDKITLSISDTGVGLSTKDISKLLDNTRYSTRGTYNEKGSGIGLDLCKDFIRKNRGDFLIESELGKGSIFSLSLLKHP